MFWRKNRAGLFAVAIVLALIAGEAAGFALPALCGLWPWSAYSAAFTILVSVGWKIRGLRYAFVGMIGITLAWHTESSRKAIEDKSLQTDNISAPPKFTLKVESDPKIFRRESEGTYRITFNSSIGDIPARVVARRAESAAIPKRGELWQCSGWLTLKKGSAHRYSRHTLWITHEDTMKRIQDRSTVDEWYPRLTDTLASRAEIGLGWNPQIAALNKAMLLGMSSEMPREKRKTFSDAGTVHVFAISGLHVMTVAMLITSLLSRFGAGASARCVTVIPALAAYVTISGCKPSAIRAAVMAAAWMTAGMFSRKPDSLTAWSLAATLTYTFCPASFFDPGCTLSFIVMLGLLLWLKWSSQFAPIASIWLNDYTFEHAIGDAAKAKRIKRRFDIVNWLTGALGISLATWIAGVPVVAALFGKISPAGIFANIIVVPLAGISVVLGAVGIGASFFSTHLGALFNNLAALCTIGMDFTSRMAAAIPYGTIDTLPWKLPDCAIWYLSWFIMFAMLSKHLKRREAVSFHNWRNEP